MHHDQQVSIASLSLSPKKNQKKTGGTLLGCRSHRSSSYELKMRLVLSKDVLPLRLCTQRQADRPWRLRGWQKKTKKNKRPQHGIDKHPRMGGSTARRYLHPRLEHAMVVVVGARCYFFSPRTTVNGCFRTIRKKTKQKRQSSQC